MVMTRQGRCSAVHPPICRHCNSPCPTLQQGSYDGPEGWQALAAVLNKREAERPYCPAGRLYYLALPPSVYPQA